MSISASISIQLGKKGNEKIHAKELINTLVSDKWELQNDGKISYLPLGDDDDFDWQDDEITIKELLDIIDKKEKLGEIVGVSMLWDTTDIGVQLLIRSELELSFLLNVNRKTLISSDSKNLTDVNWYLERIILVLKKNNYTIESFTFDEYS